MPQRDRLILGISAVVAAGAVALGFVAFGVATAPADANPAPAAAVVMTEFPGLVAASGAPEVPSMATMHPLAGSVVEAPGPFDERFEFESLAFDGATVTGAVLITSDVSDLLELEVVAGFYDAAGALIGTDRFVHHLGDEGHSTGGSPVEVEDFAVAVPAELAGSVASVAVGVPVLVNE